MTKGKEPKPAGEINVTAHWKVANEKMGAAEPNTTASPPKKASPKVDKSPKMSKSSSK